MGSATNTVRIPVIDISDANPDAPQQLLDSASQFGFIFVANNSAGISPQLIDKLFQISKDFFALPTEVKEEVSISSNKAGKNHGWLSQGVEKLDPKVQKRPDVKEYVATLDAYHTKIPTSELICHHRAFNLSLPNPEGTFDQPLPDLLQQNIQDLIAFETACHTLCQRILTHLATSLSIPEDWFTSRHDYISQGVPASSVFRLLYYPQQTASNDEVDIRAGAHSDYGSVTCLFQLPGMLLQL